MEMVARSPSLVLGSLDPAVSVEIAFVRWVLADDLTSFRFLLMDYPKDTYSG